MKVALAVTSTRFGGAERYMLDLYRRLVDQHNVSVTLVGAIPGWDPQLGPVASELGSIPEKLTARRSKTIQLLEASRIVRAQRTAILRGRFDVVHMQYKREQLLLSPAVAKTHPVLWTEHGLLPPTLPRIAAQGYVRNARRTKVLAVAEHVQEALQSKGVAAGLLLNPIPDVEAIEPDTARKQLGERYGVHLAATARLFVYVGRVDRAKRLELLLDAACKMPRDVFVIAGDGTQRSRLTAVAPPNVRFLGHVEDTQLIFSASNAAVIPSGVAANEGSPLAVLEARAVGAPTVVMSDNHAAREAIGLGCVAVEANSDALVGHLESFDLAVGRSMLPTETTRARSQSSWAMQYFSQMASLT